VFWSLLGQQEIVAGQPIPLDCRVELNLIPQFRVDRDEQEEIMQKLFSTTRLVGLGAVIGAAIASSASAQVSSPALTLVASNGAGTHTTTVPFGSFTATVFAGQPAWEYTLPAQDLFDGLNYVARLDAPLFIRYTSESTGQHRQQINSLSFTVKSGTSDTTFSVLSGVLSFSPLANLMALATTGATLTDTGSNAASVTGLHAGGKMYRANYNGAIPGGTAFALLNGSYANAGGSTVQNSSITPSVAVAGTASNIQAQWAFELSANDAFGVTSRYQMMPAPASILAFAGAMLGAARRRR